MAPRSVVLHGHFYQPPREDPWLDEVPVEPSAAPFHDWNERIERECYRAVTAARLPGPSGRIARIVNTLEAVSFDVGPTLLAWLERSAPDTYAAVLDADRRSAARLGRGNALAAPYHHTILPLATRRDKQTEIRWGIADFRHRFGRGPEGMWLPETAVDDETLDVLAEAGIAFTIVAPHQVEGAPADGTPGTYRTAAGRGIALCVYDGPLAHDVAFGTLLRDAARWVERLVTAPGTVLTSLATDGETFGHHHAFGEMALAAALDILDRRDDVRVGNYAAFLARGVALSEVALVAPTSWSCPHGVERWKADCGCKVAPERPSQQRWRASLRAALEWLAAELHAVFERDGAEVARDPWATRDDYGTVVVNPAARSAFLERHGTSRTPDARRRLAELLEMERCALGMFTSCGWFHDDIGGIESRQVLRYAARAIDLSGRAALHEELAHRLEPARSNDETLGSGRDVYERLVRPRIAPIVRVAAGWEAARATGHDPRQAVPAPFHVERDDAGLAVDDTRTGRRHRLLARSERTRTADLSVIVTPLGGARRPVRVPELPEAARHRVSAELVRAVIARWFSDDDRAQAAANDTARVAADALTRAIAILADGTGPEAVERVLDLADLTELLGLSVPYEAQTRFAAVAEAAGSERPPALAAVGRRLGFE